MENRKPDAANCGESVLIARAASSRLVKTWACCASRRRATRFLPSEPIQPVAPIFTGFYHELHGILAVRAWESDAQRRSNFFGDLHDGESDPGVLEYPWHPGDFRHRILCGRKNVRARASGD
jgi:hypothetical protein